MYVPGRFDLTLTYLVVDVLWHQDRNPMTVHASGYSSVHYSVWMRCFNRTCLC